MRTYKTSLISIACLLAVAIVSFPLSAAAQGAHKYGFVNISKVITQSDEGQVQAKELEAMGAQKQKELNRKKKALDDLNDKYQKTVKAGKPDPALQEQLKRLQRELDRDAQEAQSDVDSSRKDRIQTIGNKAVDVIRKYGKENGYTAIFRVDSGEMVYVDPSVDVTDKIIAEYNKEHPAKK